MEEGYGENIGWTYKHSTSGKLKPPARTTYVALSLDKMLFNWKKECAMIEPRRL